jgi:hypothetical protein
MNYKILLLLILIPVTGVNVANAENSRYRVEVLVLQHLDHQQEPLEVVHLPDFSAALDFLQPPEEAADEEPEPAPVADASAVPDEGESESAEPAIEPDPWNVVTHVEEMGPEMAEAWRRLRLSAAFRPLQYLSWEQGSNPPFPVLRVHDLESVLVEDPWAEQRLALAEADSAIVFADAAAMAEDAETTDGEDAVALPDPISYYRLDGTVSLIRTRFLHLSIGAEWREPVYPEESGAGVPLAAAADALPASSDAPEAGPRPRAFLVHRLEQSRPVRSGRMEYFDGPVLGVLAWVSDISDTVVEETPD